MRAVAESPASPATAKPKAACVHENTIKPMSPAEKRAAMNKPDPVEDRKADAIVNKIKNKPNLKPETLSNEVGKVITHVGKRSDDIPQMTAMVNDKLKAIGVMKESEDGETIVDQLRSVLFDMLTPMAVNKITSISIDSIIEKLGQEKTGLELNRPLIMKILDPKTNSMITKIEGDTVYFRTPAPQNNKADDQAEKDKKSITSKAAKQAKASITKKK